MLFILCFLRNDDHWLEYAVILKLFTYTFIMLFKNFQGAWKVKSCVYNILVWDIFLNGLTIMRQKSAKLNAKNLRNAINICGLRAVWSGAVCLRPPPSSGTEQLKGEWPICSNVEVQGETACNTSAQTKNIDFFLIFFYFLKSFCYNL